MDGTDSQVLEGLIGEAIKNTRGEIMRIVLDTNLLISSILTPDGNPSKILNDILAGTFTLVISSEIIEV